MAFTYRDDPENVARDAVRLLIGDTDSSDPLLSDAEIAFYLSENGSNNYRAGSEACKAIAAKLARLPDFSAGSVRITNRRDEFLKLADTLSRRAITTTVAPYAGGISKTDKQTGEENTDRVEPFFTRNDFVQPGTDRLANSGTV